MITTLADMRAAASRNLVRVKGSALSFYWGTQGAESLVARLASNAIGGDFKAEEGKPYAELWLGTHQDGQSFYFDSPATSLLSQVRLAPQHFLGDETLRRWPKACQVPFLLKVLSISTSMPIQVHPDKQLAAALRGKYPKTFSHSNHKPEVVVAIGETIEGGAWGEDVAFAGFVGFLPLERIAENIKSANEVRLAIGDDALVDQFLAKPTKGGLKGIFSALLNRAPEDVEPHIRSLVHRIKKGEYPPPTADADLSAIARLVTKMDAQHPGDVAVLATAFFMNFIKLRKGEAMYVGQDELHAYLEGDILECLIVSDIAVDASKVRTEERPAKEFVEAITYTSRAADHWRLKSKPFEKSGRGVTKAYAPAGEGFAVLCTSFGQGGKETLREMQGPTIGIVTTGKARVVVGKESEELETGGAFFVVPGKDVEIEGEGQVWWATVMV